MASVTFRSVSKTYRDGPKAVDDLNLEIGDGEFMVLVGPSGCGKSTALRMIAGLEEVSGGDITIGDRVVNEVPPGDRDIAMVFQNYALYPHMTVRQNIGFALEVAKVPRREIAERVGAAAAMLGLTEYLDRLPKALSGGQRQRVAMGRAIVRSPQVFLMDEPLSNLDAKLRVQMRAEIIQLQARLGTTMVYVTHDQVEAMTMGHRVAVMRKGVLQQVAPPQELYNRPANLFVAAFIGSPAMNLVTVVVNVAGDRVLLDLAGQTLRVPEAALDRYPGLRERHGSSVILGVRPEHFVMAADTDAPDDHAITLTTRLAESMGAEVHIHGLIDTPPPSIDVLDVATDDDLTGEGTKVIARVDGVHTVTRGDEVRLAVRMHLVHFFDSTTGEPLR